MQVIPDSLPTTQMTITVQGNRKIVIVSNGKDGKAYKDYQSLIIFDPDTGTLTNQVAPGSISRLPTTSIDNFNMRPSFQIWENHIIYSLQKAPDQWNIFIDTATP